MTKQKTIWTIGHSTHPIEEFTAMLKSFRIELLVDIRSYPGSKRYPQYNKEVIANTLIENDIEYIHLKNLGGRRKTTTDSRNTAWRNASFRGYADYMETESFKKAVIELENLATQKRIAIMCSESVWWRCHRSLVSDYLKFNGWEVMHIMDIEKSEGHPYTKPAVTDGNELSYSSKKENQLPLWPENHNTR